ncbi:MAG TPA: hypothetical protein PKZ12_02445, partial [Smithellaceae bacterium]|nr:hypothetical protein [Smithellaceae bacterium]
EVSLGKHEVGGRAAAPIWLYFMEKALEGTAAEAFAVPDGIIFVKVDQKTGVPVKTAEKKTIYECFLENAVPSENSNEISGGNEDIFR